MKRIVYHISRHFIFITAMMGILSACKSGPVAGEPAFQENASDPSRSKPGAALPPAPEELMVFAAASLTDVMTDITAAFEQKTNIRVLLNLASSGTLARQVELGNQPDVFVSASKKWADYLAKKGFTQKKWTQTVAHNELVLVSHVDSSLGPVKIDADLNFPSLSGDERLSLGDPAHVPAGKYAKEALDHFEWYAPMKDKLLPAKDVRSALMVVELGEAPVGIVYRTDAEKSSKVKILGVFPEASHNPIQYVATVCSQHREAVDLFHFLTSPEAVNIWKKYGFPVEQ
jgi:molybdate transport system substrate-binding protein